MRVKKIGKKLLFHFTYDEWMRAGKQTPLLPEGTDTDGFKVENVMSETPEDKKDYFLGLGYLVRLCVNKGKGFKIWER